MRLLTHFYAFLFFEDYDHDLWAKRFVRDHLRYVDEIQCAAARIASALKEKARASGIFVGGGGGSVVFRRGSGGGRVEGVALFLDRMSMRKAHRAG